MGKFKGNGTTMDRMDRMQTSIIPPVSLAMFKILSRSLSPSVVLVPWFPVALVVLLGIFRLEA